MTRQEALTAIRTELQDNLKFAADHLHNLREGLGSSEGGAAGDTHETGRTILEEEIQQAEDAKARAEEAMNEFERSVANPPNDHVSMGNVVKTSMGTFFIGAALGKFESEAGELMAVSLESPMGHALLGAVPGDKVEFQGKEIEVETVG